MKRFKMLKRSFDIVTAIVGLIITSPVLLVAAAFIKSDGGPVFFLQDRAGLNGHVFQVLKFRSMIVDADLCLDSDGRPTRERITKVGRIIRKTSIDELPQFLNIFFGDMSVVGPRPILPVMLPYMTPLERIRLEVRPGVTGLSQIKGRNFLKWSRRFHYDVIYVRRQSLALDLWILWRTIKVVAFSEGIANDRNPGQVNDITTRKLTQSKAG